jgi:hypothetical protein
MGRRHSALNPQPPIERRQPCYSSSRRATRRDLCPKDEGGSKTLYNPVAEGVKLVAMYGAFPEHVIYYIVESDKVEAIEAYLFPGFKRCTSKITPVSQVPIVQ